jgi:hypothetical protein
MSLLVELAGFFLLELYTFCASGASQVPEPQNPVQSAELKFTTKITKGTQKT